MNNYEHIPPGDIEQIERFLQGDMSAEERQAFVHRMNQDTALKQTTEEMEMLFLGIQEASLQKRLDRYHEDLSAGSNNHTGSPKKSFSPKAWLAAAAVVIATAFSIWWFLLKTGREDDLYARYFHPDPGLPTLMSTTETYAFDRAMIDYKTGGYAAAIKAWDSLLQLNPQSDTLNYFLGSAWLAMKEPKKAIALFEKIIANPRSVFIKDAYWYLGLVWLKEGDITKAKSFILQSDHAEKESLLSNLNE